MRSDWPSDNRLERLESNLGPLNLSEIELYRKGYLDLVRSEDLSINWIESTLRVSDSKICIRSGECIVLPRTAPYLEVHNATWNARFSGTFSFGSKLQSAKPSGTLVLMLVGDDLMTAFSHDGIASCDFAIILQGLFPSMSSGCKRCSMVITSHLVRSTSRLKCLSLCRPISKCIC